jgi:hypothetical protein
MDSSTKSPGRPPIYGQLHIDIEINTEAAEIGFLRSLLSAHILKVNSGNITDAGRTGLLNILEDLNTVEHLLKGK